MKLLEFTNYCERAKALSLPDDAKALEPFEQADGSAEMREYSKIWVVGTTVAGIGLYTLGYMTDPNILWFPFFAGVLWKGFTIQHNHHAVIAQKLLAEYSTIKSE